MKPGIAAASIIVIAASGAVAAAPANGSRVSGRIAVHVETVANLENGTIDACEAVQLGSAGSSLSFAFWSTLGDAGGTRCGPGSYSGPSESGQAPFLIQEVSTVVGWDPRPMDPGPVGAVQAILTLTRRQRTGLSKEGRALYGTPAKDSRSTRLEPGEEFILPVLLDPGGHETLGVHEVMIRVRAGWVDREGAAEYGALAITDAAPGSDVVLDGGVAGTVGADGRLLLSNVTVGQREIRLRGASGSVVSRIVTLVKRRTVVVVPEAADGGAPRQPVLTPIGKNPEGFEEYRRARDGAIMIRIPEGEFLMGNLETEGKPPPHVVHASSFLMDKLPLTVGRYQRFAAATGRPLPPDPYWGLHEDFPVAFVRWDEAKAYCEWVGGRLPTEAEREKAARGTDGRMFPWGSEAPSPQRAVFSRYWGEGGPDTVGTRPSGASPYGLLDAEGNMWEFCEDWWDPDYYPASPRNDPTGPKTGRARVARGGSWDSRWVVLSASKRNFAYIGYREGDFGFRCAAESPR